MTKYPKSLVPLIIANTVPVFGVLFFEWEFGEFIFAYWLETVTIGLFNVLKMIYAEGESSWQKYGQAGWFRNVSRAKIIIFFIFHFGFFSLGHGLFILFVSSSYLVGSSRSSLILVILSLFFSHLFSFLYNYMQLRESKVASLDILFVQPYTRIWITQLTIIFGIMMVAIIGDEKALLIFFIFLKTTVDSYQHYKERAKFSPLMDDV